MLSATRSSGIFTQDMEDTERPTPSPESQLEKPEPVFTPARQDQLEKIYNLARKTMAPDEAKRIMWINYKVNDSKLLSEEQADDFIKKLSSKTNK